MKTVEFAGIPFTEERIEALKYLLTPMSKNDGSLIESHVKELRDVQSFITKIWTDDMCDYVDVKCVKSALTGLQNAIDNFSKLILNEKGGEA